MKKDLVILPDIKLVGIKIRTNNKDEIDFKKAKIGKTVEDYFLNNISEKILERKSPGITYCIYTDYESNKDGEYTYFIGEEVCSFNSFDKSLDLLTIPCSKYVKFECGPGKMPEICLNSWKEIWNMEEDILGGKRSYIADFEVYDNRIKNDNSNIKFNIFIGIKNDNKN